MSLTGPIVRSYRESKGVALLEVAYVLGLPPGIVEAMEKGDANYGEYLTSAHSAVQKLFREMTGTGQDRAWVDDVTEEGIAS